MTTPEAVRNAVFAAASKNSELLNKLAKTAEGPGLYQAQLVHCERLEESLAEQDSLLDSLSSQAELKYKTHKRFRDSVARKWYYRATRMMAKFEARSMKEEREYFEILGAQSKAEERVKLFREEVAKANADKEGLAKVAKEHGETHAKIDELYESLFKGPTPGFWDEDEAESNFYVRDEANETVKQDITKARRAKSNLGVVKTYLGRAKDNMKYAEMAVGDSLFFLDRAAYWIDRGDLSITLATARLTKAGEFLLPLELTSETSARFTSLQSVLQAAKIGDGWSRTKDVMLAAITTSLQKIEEAEGLVGELIDDTKESERLGLLKLRETARMLEDARQELQQIRQGIFERVAGFGEAAPSYLECCDRSSNHCAITEESPEFAQPEEKAHPPTHDHEHEEAVVPPYSEAEPSMSH
jgi:hypothetical protein